LYLDIKVVLLSSYDDLKHTENWNSFRRLAKIAVKYAKTANPAPVLQYAQLQAALKNYNSGGITDKRVTIWLSERLQMRPSFV